MDSVFWQQHLKSKGSLCVSICLKIAQKTEILLEEKISPMMDDK